MWKLAYGLMEVRLFFYNILFVGTTTMQFCYYFFSFKFTFSFNRFYVAPVVFSLVCGTWYLSKDLLLRKFLFLFVTQLHDFICLSYRFYI